MGVILSRTFYLVPLGFVQCSPITLQFVNNMVTLSLDGQYVDLFMDTGCPESFAVYGPEYERQNGNGTCRDIQGCYFCTLSNPCDDIFERRRRSIKFGDDGEYTLVEHSVSLTIGGMTIPNFKIGLAINCYGGKCKRAKGSILGVLGLSYGREGITETFLEQLQRRKAISSLKYWVRTERSVSAFDGNLTLDDSTRDNSCILHLSRVPRRLMLPAWPLQLLSPQGHQLTPRSGSLSEGERAIAVDTGATHIFASPTDFEKFEKSTGKYIWQNAGLLLVNKTDVHNLPTLLYGIGEPNMKSAIKIQPKHYVRCLSALCVVRIVPRASYPSAFGRPFFYAYDVGFDLESNPPSIYLKAKDADNEVETIV